MLGPKRFRLTINLRPICRDKSVWRAPCVLSLPTRYAKNEGRGLNRAHGILRRP